MGSTKFEGGLLQKCLQVKVHKTTPNQRLQLYKRITSVIMFTQFTKIQQDTKDTTKCK